MKKSYIIPHYEEASLSSKLELLDSSYNSGNLHPEEGDGEEDLTHQLFDNDNTNWGELW